MFHGGRWAAAFTGALGENAEAGLACLKALAKPLGSLRGAAYGRGAAQRLEKTLRESAALGAGAAGQSGHALEYTIRFVSLLAEKNGIRRIDSLVRRIEKLLDDKNGILDVTAETAAPLDSGSGEELRRGIMEKTGAPGIKLRTLLVPELLGGYRLRIGGLLVDASLKGQLEKMAADITGRNVRAEGAYNHGEL